jgi:hypothetical protein
MWNTSWIYATKVDPLIYGSTRVVNGNYGTRSGSCDFDLYKDFPDFGFLKEYRIIEKF